MLFRKRKYVSSTVRIYWKEPVYKWTCAVQTCVVHGSTVRTEEGRALKPKTLCLGASVQSVQVFGMFSRQNVLCLWLGESRIALSFVIWPSGPHASMAGSHLSSLRYFTLFLSTLFPWPEVVSDPSHFSKLGPLDCTVRTGCSCCACSVDPEHVCAAGLVFLCACSESCWAEDAPLQDLCSKQLLSLQVFVLLPVLPSLGLALNSLAHLPEGGSGRQLV